MATLQETVKAVLAELQALGVDLQESDIASDAAEFTLILGFKEDGEFVRISPTMLRSATTRYLTQDEYDALVAAGTINEDVEYNIYEE